MRLNGCSTSGNLRAPMVTGMRFFGPNKDMGSHITLTVVRSTRRGNVLGPNTAVVRPADNGANMNLTLMSTMGNCRLVLAVPRAVDIRHEGLIGTCNTRIELADNGSKVPNTVGTTRRLHSSVPNSIVLKRFAGPTGPTGRCTAAKPRV